MSSNKIDIEINPEQLQVVKDQLAELYELVAKIEETLDRVRAKLSLDKECVEKFYD